MFTYSYDNMNNKKIIIVEADIYAPIEKVWERYTKPEYILQWNHASDDWHTSDAENDLRTGGKFNYRMEAKDKSIGFDFTGTYTEVKIYEYIAYILDDGRKVEARFVKNDNATRVVVSFEAEDENPIELQREGWQSILNNFKKYAEENI